MQKTKPSGSEQVTDFIAKLDHPLRAIVEQLRRIILDIDVEIAEQIKWNSPAFYYSGEMAPFDPKEYARDLVVMHLRRKDEILLVFPIGAKIPDTTGILEGTYTDGRRMITLKSAADLEAKREALKLVIKQWLELVNR